MREGHEEEVLAACKHGNLSAIFLFFFIIPFCVCVCEIDTILTWTHCSFASCYFLFSNINFFLFFSYSFVERKVHADFLIDMPFYFLFFFGSLTVHLQTANEIQHRKTKKKKKAKTDLNEFVGVGLV